MIDETAETARVKLDEACLEYAEAFARWNRSGLRIDHDIARSMKRRADRALAIYVAAYARAAPAGGKEGE